MSSTEQPTATQSLTAYCVRCRAKRTIKDPQKVTMKNGRAATKGTCPECGTNLTRIGG